MGFSKFSFNPADGLRNVVQYPTVPASEAEAREQIQGRLDEIKNYLNNILTSELDVHTHTKTQITDFAHKLTHASGGADALTPADIGAAPSAHSHGLITSDGKAGILSNMALYTISSGVIDAGTLPIAAGGTGGTTAATARANLEAAAASDLAAHLAETVLKTNKTINVPGNYSTIQAALDSLEYTWIPKYVTVTIQVAAGTYTHTSPIVIDHPCGSQIQIVGATPITTTVTGVGTI